ncbi:hypothetical protein XENOCAPTIV_023118 [Xenoophorus captivus]|uniref:Uncharacterized protein n=1 Tax=Xenoophorus captivus TaxID=1517983 RepID=A0ABV0QE50_9TELE
MFSPAETLSPFVFSAREAELRRLRKANIEFEEQNAVLQRHINDMNNAKERLEAELGQDEKRTQALHQHLLAIKHTLVNSLSAVPLPGQKLHVGYTGKERVDAMESWREILRNIMPCSANFTRSFLISTGKYYIRVSLAHYASSGHMTNNPCQFLSTEHVGVITSAKEMVQILLNNTSIPHTITTRSDVTAVRAAGGAEAEQDGCVLGTRELRESGRGGKRCLDTPQKEKDGAATPAFSVRARGRSTVCYCFCFTGCQEASRAPLPLLNSDAWLNPPSAQPLIVPGVCFAKIISAN